MAPSSVLAAGLFLAAALVPARAQDHAGENAAAASARVFDGSALSSVSEDGASVVDARFENGGLRRFTYLRPQNGFSLEVGDLGQGAGVPSLGSSPYLSLGKDWAGSGSWLDWGLKTRVSALDLQSRYFDTRGPYDSQRLYLLSAAANAGRAFPLWGPVDFGWSVMALARVDQYFPNAALDETAGLRVRLNPDHQVGLFGGVTQAAGLLSRDWAAQAIDGGKLSSPRVDSAPHVEVGAWGRLRGDASYEAWAARQSNPFSDLTRLEGSLSRPGLGGRVSAGLKAETESGDGIQFDRRQRALTFGLTQDDGKQWGVEAGRQAVRYGDASMDGNYVMFTFRIPDAGGKKTSVRASHAWSDARVSEGANEFSRLDDDLAEAAASLDALRAGLSAVAAAGPRLPAAIAELQARYDALPANLRAALEAQLGRAPDFDSLERLPADAARLNQALGRLQAVLSDRGRMERVLTGALQTAFYESLSKTTIQLWGKDIPVTPGLLIALVHANSLGLSPVPPVGGAAYDAAAQTALMAQLRRKYPGACAPDADPVTCAMDELPPEVRARLEGVPADKAREIVADAVGFAGRELRRQMNALLLNAYLAARRLDDLTVERGDAAGTLNRRAVMDSFSDLDRRRAAAAPAPARAVDRALFDSAAQRLRREVEEEDRALAAAAAERGARLGRELRAAGVDASDEDLSRLAAEYGEDNLRVFALATRAKLAGFGAFRMALRFDPDPVMGLSISRGKTVTVSLPPGGRDPGFILDALSSALR